MIIRAKLATERHRECLGRVGKPWTEQEKQEVKLAYLETILFPFVPVAKVVWAVLKWIPEILGRFFSAFAEC